MNRKYCNECGNKIRILLAYKFKCGKCDKSSEAGVGDKLCDECSKTTHSCKGCNKSLDK